MAKDAKGHGSDKRGEFGRRDSNTLRATIDARHNAARAAMANADSTDKAAAATLGGGHPKAAAVPVHDAMSKQYFPRMSGSDKQASRDRDSASSRDEYNRDLMLRSRNGQVGSGMKYRG